VLRDPGAASLQVKPAVFTPAAEADVEDAFQNVK
jgi:hypothetical protein